MCAGPTGPGGGDGRSLWGLVRNAPAPAAWEELWNIPLPGERSDGGSSMGGSLVYLGMYLNRVPNLMIRTRRSSKPPFLGAHLRPPSLSAFKAYDPDP